MEIFDTKELIKLVNKGCREYRVLVDYLRHARDIENIENLEKEIKDLYPKEKDIYVELSNYYTSINDIEKSIKNLERYKKNGGKGINVLLLLLKQYLSVNLIQEAELILQPLLNDSVTGCEKDINEILQILNIKKREKNKIKHNNETNHSNELYKKDILKKILEKDCVEYHINKLLYLNQNSVNKILYDLVCEAMLMESLFKNNVIKVLYSNIKHYNAFDDIVDISKDNNNIIYLIKFICYLIEQDDTDSFLIENLSKILDNRQFNNSIKNNILNIISNFHKNSNNIRAKNIFLNEIEILQNKTFLLSKPRYVDVVLTSKCNLKCIMCCNGYDNDYEIDDTLYNYLTDNMKYFNKIEWKGGEVFLYKNFMNLMIKASESKVAQEIVTNGILLNEKYIDIFVKNNVSLVISIDAVNKDLYEKIRTGAKFEKLLNNLNLLKSIKEKNDSFSYNMNVVLMTNNYKQIKEIIDFALFYKFSAISFLDCSKNKEINNEYLVLNKEQIQYVYKQYKEKERELANNKAKLFIHFDTPLKFLNKDYKNIDCNNNKIMKNNEEKNDLCNDSDNVFNRVKKNFCTLPWRNLVFCTNYNISFGCQCRDIDISAYNILKDDIWNCEKLVTYRDNILKYGEKSCKVFLEKNK